MPSPATKLPLVLALVSCVAEGPPREGAAELPPDAPLDRTGELDSAWSYLLDRYDTDADGRIVAGEYGREAGSFARLDADADGMLTSADFPADRNAEIEAHVEFMLAQAAFARFFQEDDDDESLPLAELEWAFDSYDTDGDGEVSAAEFDALADARAHELPEAAHRMVRVASAMTRPIAPFEAILACADRDADGRLGRPELVEFFRATSGNTDVWIFDSANLLEPGTQGDAAPGTLAPDFTLHSTDGGEPVTLSSFRGSQPVALVFGSYT
jgi:Ca2+-binding EF-hand superfamily protein